MLAVGVLSAVIHTAATGAPEPMAATKRAKAMPARGMTSLAPAVQWQDALVSGNGTLGAMVFGDPAAERIILNHEKFNQPQRFEPLPPPEIGQYLPQLRRMMRRGEYNQAWTFWNEMARKHGHPGLVWTDAFHPAYALTITSAPSGEAREYLRSVNFETGEATVWWTDDRGEWRRRLFVSRTDGVIVQSIDPPDGATVDCVLGTDEKLEKWTEELAVFTKRADPDWLIVRGRYPAEKSHGGFEGVTRIVAQGGTARADGDRVIVEGAGRVLLLTQLERIPDFDRSAVPALQTRLVACGDSYDGLLVPHAAAHGGIFDRVRIELGAGEGRRLTSEELIAREEADTATLDAALLEKMFDMGRYVLLSSSGDWPPRLPGVWTGSWDPEWRGDFTTDANINLAISGANIGAMPEAMNAYCNLIEGIVDDWKINAWNLLGCHGVMAGTRTDGEHNLHTHFSKDFEGAFWTAGAQWLTQPLYEYWQTTGDETFLRERLLPIMLEVARFHEDFLVEYDADGRYLFIPSYSPENKPQLAPDSVILPPDGEEAPRFRGGWPQVNATMDIAAAKEALTNLIGVCEILGIEEQGVKRWKAMLTRMPPYLVNEDGALKEWATPALRDNYNHRHLSHLYPLWPGLEITPGETPELFEAARTAAHLRGMGNESAHGLMHMALVATRLKDAPLVHRNLQYIQEHGYIYSSMVTSHNPKRRIFNVDASCSLPTVVMEMLVYSRPGEIELLPALDDRLGKGSIEGVLCRGRVKVEELKWDLEAGTVEARLISPIDQTVTLRLRRGIETIGIDGEASLSEAGDADSRSLTLTSGAAVTLRIGLEKP
jgi:hypothetical protein